MTEFIRKDRRCGCDCRDEGTYEPNPEIFNPLGCEVCGSNKPPCHYVAHIPCQIKFGDTIIANAGDLTLMPVCPFENACVYSEPDLDDFDPNQCTATNGDSAILPKLWVMDISASPVKLIYSFSFISIEFTVIGTWDCFNENTVEVSYQYPSVIDGLPNRICITPDMTNGCNTTCNGGGCQEDAYDTEANRLSCCDPNCDDLAFSGRMRFKKVDGTGTVTEISRSIHGTSTGVPGINSPSGPSYGVTRNNADFALPFGDGVRAVMYCSSGIWYCDWYHAPSATPSAYTFVSTSTFTSSCCPLSGCTSPIVMTMSSGDFYVCAVLGSATDCFDCGSLPCTGECKYVAATGTPAVQTYGGIATTLMFALTTDGPTTIEIGGPGGGGGASESGRSDPGQGGGSGGYSVASFTGVAGDIITVIIGAAGLGGSAFVASPWDGEAGGTTSASSSLGAFTPITATGGQGGAGDSTSGATGAGGIGNTLNGAVGLPFSGTTGGDGGIAPGLPPGGGGPGIGGLSNTNGTDSTSYGGGGGGGGKSADGGDGGGGWVRLTTPVFTWLYSSDTCTLECTICPTVDAAFYLEHGHPVSSGDELFVDCVS